MVEVEFRDRFGIVICRRKVTSIDIVYIICDTQRKEVAFKYDPDVLSKDAIPVFVERYEN